MSGRPKVLIEDWLPAAAIGVECMREENNPVAKPPHKYLHVWWARRPLTASRAAILGSLLPMDFNRETFERLLGFGRPSQELVFVKKMHDSKEPGTTIDIGYDCKRAFKNGFLEKDIIQLKDAVNNQWVSDVVVMDPMAGGGSIPLEAVRMGFKAIANELNPVACTVLESTIEYPFLINDSFHLLVKKWGRILEDRLAVRVEKYFIERSPYAVKDYIYARTVPCPDTGKPTPLVPSWYLLNPKSGRTITAIPIIDEKNGTWYSEIKEVGNSAGQITKVPTHNYANGKGISLYTGRPIDRNYIKAMAQAGKMKSQLYAIAVKTNKGLEFFPPEPTDLNALEAAEKAMDRKRPEWEAKNIIPTESTPPGDKTRETLVKGMNTWAELFSPRQLLVIGTLVDELNKLHIEILNSEGNDVGEKIIHLLSFSIDKLINYNSCLASWKSGQGGMRSTFDRHDFSFKATWAEIAPINSGGGFKWAVNNTLKAFKEIANLPTVNDIQLPDISLGSATHLPHIPDQSITAVVVDPPYADNVQYSELADFFYVWLKRTQGHRRPEWFSTYLCDHDEEAVVNISRHRDNGEKSAKEAREDAYVFYNKLMAETFAESKRILRDDGVLTVMFTHKKQEAWEGLFQSLIDAGFTITATWPIKTESEHSLHQAKKNAAQSTVILVARKRMPNAGKGYYDSSMKEEIRNTAASSAERLQGEGLNAVDQMVGSFGPAMEVFSRYDEVVTDTGEPVNVGQAIDEAADAVSEWRINQLAERGLDGVEPEGQFYLLCWDVLGAQEFRFNEAKLLGHAVGMDVNQLITAGLVTKKSDKIIMQTAKERRRERPLEPDEVVETLFGDEIKTKRRSKKDVLKVHPNDPEFRTALDACHALALRYEEGGLGSAKSLARQQNWTVDSAVSKLMEALVKAAPIAVRFDKGSKSAGHRFPEFRAWHVMLKEIFDIIPEEWKEEFNPTQGALFE